MSPAKKKKVVRKKKKKPARKTVTDATDKHTIKCIDDTARSVYGKAIRKNSILVNMRDVYEQTRALVLTGDPDKDWQATRSILEGGGCTRLKEIAEEVRNVRIWAEGHNSGRRYLRTGATTAGTSTPLLLHDRHSCGSTSPLAPNPPLASWS